MENETSFEDKDGITVLDSDNRVVKSYPGMGELFKKETFKKRIAQATTLQEKLDLLFEFLNLA